MSFSSLWSHSLSRKNRRVIWALLFVIALVPRAWYISATDSTNLVNQDPMCRINIANAWMVEDQYPRTMVWPPLHMVLLALPSYLSGHVPYEKIDKGISVEDGGRALTAVLGSLLVVFIFEWALLFLPWQGAFASALTMAFWPLSVYLGSITLAEVPFMAFLFAALLALIRYRQSPQLRWIYVAAVLFNCASLIRFEGWLFATTLPLILVLPMMGWKPSSSGKTHLLLLWLFNSLAPFYSLAKSAQLHGGDMLRALTINQLETEAEAVVFAKTIGLQSQLSKIIANALMPNYSWFGLLILVGLIWHLRQRKFMALLLLVCIPALPKYWSVLSFAIPSDPRYLFTSTCLLWPLGFFLIGLRKRAPHDGDPPPWRTGPFGLSLAVPLVLVGYSLWRLPQEAHYRAEKGFSSSFKEAASLVRQLRLPHEAVLGEISHSDHCGFAVLAGIPAELFRMPPPPTYFNQERWQKVSVDSILALSHESLRWIVVDPKGEVLPKAVVSPEFHEKLATYGLNARQIYPHPSLSADDLNSFSVYLVLEKDKSPRVDD